MNQNAILRSNLLDIIFENRNKDYGAYTLRKTYNRRLSVAVLSVVGVSMLLGLFLLSENTSVILTPIHPGILVPVTELSSFGKDSWQVIKKTAQHHPALKSANKIERQPLIVASDNINNLPATPAEIEPSLKGLSDQEANPGTGEGGDGNNLGGSIPTPVIKPADGAEEAPVDVAEIMPQFPGGIGALLSFLKKNIHSPGEVEEGTAIAVQIEFVVNYDGNLERFAVVKSGGEIFDTEVIRVLKKMPLWIPGKSKGRNVSVYYTLPVKFTNEF